MDHLHYTTIEHRKGQHLSFAHRVLIQTRLKDGWSANRIAREIGCAPNTVRNEIRCGTVALYTGTILRSQYSEHWNDICKTITTDNGSEFSMLSELEGLRKTLVYFAHPYTSCEKASVERHNGLIRRFIPKGKRIESYSDEQIAQIEVWCNGLPRKRLGYHTPDELFEEDLDRIYSCAA